MGWSLNTFFEQHFITVYFLYGLSFFVMGLGLLMSARREARLRLAEIIHLLGLFALLHGTHEFLEMLMLVGELRSTFPLEVVRLSLLALSFLLLLAFGIALLPRAETVRRFTLRTTIVVMIAYVVQQVLLYLTYQPSVQEWVHSADTLTRYTLGIPGSALAGFGLWRQRRVLIRAGITLFGTHLAIAAAALITYGVIGQFFPNPSLVFPSMYVNSELFARLFGFPVQVLRAVMALVAAVAMIRAVRAFEYEARRQLESAVETKRELQVAARELSLLYEASSLLTATYDLETLIQKAVDRIVPIIEPLQFAAIYVPPKERGFPGHLSMQGASSTEPAYVQKVLEQHIEYGRTSPEMYSYWVDKNGADVSMKVKEQVAANMQTPPLALRRVVLPLQTQSHMVGSLLLETAPGGPYLSSHEAPTIIALARQLAIAIENAGLLLELRQREVLHTELLQRATSAQEAERKRIARELHDDTGQALTALALGLRGASKLAQQRSGQVAEQIQQLEEISTRALDELRHMISDLRPSHLDDLGLVAALRWYVEQLKQRSDVNFSFHTSGEICRLQPEAETTLFRIAQEGLGNVVKHARATHAELLLAYQKSCVCLRISDDGHGFDKAAVLEPGAGRAWGLIGIQERATLAGGKLEIATGPGMGTRIAVCVPVSREVSDTGRCLEKVMDYE